MRFLVILAGVVACALAVDLNERQDNRIISGKPAVYGQFPWQVESQFTLPSRTTFCGSALISNQWILTAAHCATGASNFTLRLGGLTLSSEEEGRISIPSATYFVHPGYNSNVHFDVALVKLDSPVEFNDRIQPVRLPARGEQMAAGRKVTVSGWGKTSDSSNQVSNILNFVQLTTITNEECTSVYGNGIIIDSTVCCRGNPEHSTCNGDSGGPLVEYDNDGVATHIGVVSWVHTDGCASGNPSGYVRTEAMLSWIAEITGLDV